MFGVKDTSCLQAFALVMFFVVLLVGGEVAELFKGLLLKEKIN